MPEEARIEETEHGKVVKGEGWFVLNLGEAVGTRLTGSGIYCTFEAEDARFEQYGINVHVLLPGEPNCLYHAESDQESFLVLDGECTLLVEEEERTLRAWDFVHFPPGTRHVVVGSGDGPCAVLMVGIRGPNVSARYPVSQLAARYGASADEDTEDSKAAYARWPKDFRTERFPWPPS